LRLVDFGLRDGINEVIGITKNKWINAAPLGIIVDDENSREAKLRLFGGHTFENIKNGSPLWVNIIYDPIIFVITSFDDPDEKLYTSLDPPILKSALAWCKFDVTNLEGNIAYLILVDGQIIRKSISAINRGFNALIECLVYATKYIQLRNHIFLRKIKEYKEIIEKCGGKREIEALSLLINKLRERGIFI